MRGLTAILLCGSLFGAVAQGADPTFPYTVQIAVNDVEVRCGPGWDYYATQRLTRGTEVEVYRQDPGGWLAIRPPQGSFSWLTARHLKLTADKSLGEVGLDGAVAWVGSSVTNVPQHKWQVRLARDERVEVLGEQAMTVGPGIATETYYRIAPPAGEFRWIHAQHATTPQAAREAASQAQAQSDYRRVSDPPARAAAPAVAAPAARQLLSVPESAKQVEELKIALSLLVTQEIEQWDLASLKQRAETLSQQVVDSALAQDIKAIVRRMEEFETLQKRYRKSQDQDVSKHRVGGSAASAGDTPPAGKESAASDAQGAAAAPRLLKDAWARDIDTALGTDISPASAESGGTQSGGTQSGGTQYDAEGWLMPVHSTKRVAPPFAVLNDDGRVQAYVTPAPGLNLRRYAKQYVGLIGGRRYVDALRAPHVTAERVVKQQRD